MRNLVCREARDLSRTASFAQCRSNDLLESSLAETQSSPIIVPNFGHSAGPDDFALPLRLFIFPVVPRMFCFDVLATVE